MALRPESVDEWCQLMPNLLEEEGWNEALVNSEAALMHASCPWGGHLIKLELKGITINDAPAKTGNVLVRPEVRAQYQEQCPVHGHEVQSVGFVAPGEAVVEASTTWAVLRLCSVLFGDMAQQVMNYFFRSSTDPVDWHQKVRRDFPKSGDSACAFWKEDDDEQTRECLVVVRPETADKFTAFVVARTHEDRFARWATGHFGMVLSSARSTAESYLNRPGIVELRKQDEQFYVVLSMQSFKRGMPLLPALPEEKALTDINAGKPFGLSRWVRYEPESGKFFLFEYLEIFIQRLGFEVQLYDSLDGQKLVPYMCVLRRDQWEVARSRFMEAYPLQKTAYRHANGGSGAPGVHDDVPPKFMTAMSNDLEERLQTLKEPRLVVKNTFLDVEEEQKVRPSRRPKTTALGKPVLAH